MNQTSHDQSDGNGCHRGIIDGSVRLYARYSYLHAIRRWWITRGVREMGGDVFVEANVRLLRHPEKIKIGHRVMLKEGARLCPANPGAEISIGDWTTIGYHCFLFASTSIRIGNNCLIAPFCYLVDSNHGIKAGVLIRQQPMEVAPINIGNDVWLGNGVVVTKGVTIGNGAVVGARSLVLEDVPENAVVAGTPARIIRYRQ